MVWLKVSHETAITLLAPWDCSHPKAWPSLADLLLSSFMWFLAGGLSFLPHGLLHRAVHDMVPAFPQKKWSNTDAAVPFYDLVSKVTHGHFCFILFTRSKSPSPAHTQGVVGGGGAQELGSTSWKEEYQRICVPTHSPPCPFVTCDLWVSLTGLTSAFFGP